MNKKIGLIIQGPVLSSGVRGPLLRDKNIINQKKDESFVDFNCIDNIDNPGRLSTNIKTLSSSN